MKRFLAFALIFIVCISLSACGENESIIGTWETDVTVIGEEAPEEFHYVTMKFDTRGICTYIYYVNNKDVSGTKADYIAKDNQLTMRIDGRKIVCDYVIEGDKLTLTYNGNTQVLTRVE